VGAGFAIVFRDRARTVAGMSLNRCEQRVFDYLQKQTEERNFWVGKVQAAAKRATDDHGAAAQLEAELWRYYEERCGVVPALRQAAALEGLRRTSMRNLAELLLRLWTEPRVKKKPVGEGVG
jgi:hypothetical protein